MGSRKAISVVLTVFATFLLMAGCSSSEGSSGGGSDSGDKKTIEFMHLWPEGSSKDHYKIVNEIVAGFEKKHSDVNVDVQVLNNEQYKQKLKVLSTSNKLPDVGMTWPAGFLEPYVSGDMFATLDDVLKDGLKESFVPGTVEAYQVDGKTYGLPLELNIVDVFYNKSIFDKYHLKAPQTYEELKNVITTLKENGVAPIALGNKAKWTGSMWYMYLADRLAGPESLKKAIQGSGSFEDPAFEKAAAKVQELVDMGAFVKGFNGLSDQEAKSMFMNGQAAMYLIATWDLPNYTTNEDVSQKFRDSVDYFKFPTINGQGDKKSYVGGPGVGLFVSQNSDVKKEAKAFAKYFVKQWGKKSVSEAGVIPATKVNSEGLDLPQMYTKVLEDLNQANNLTLYADVQMSPDVAQTHLDLIQALFGGQITPEEFAKRQEAAISKDNK